MEYSKVIPLVTSWSGTAKSAAMPQIGISRTMHSKRRKHHFSRLTIALLILLSLSLMLKDTSRKMNAHYHRNALIQQRIANQTRDFRGFEDICYAGYCGPWIEEYFMDYFFKYKLTFERMYLPISWTNCHLKCSKDQLDSLRNYIMTLDLSLKYFTVLQIDDGLHHHALNLILPENLDLIVFCAGGLTKGPQISNVHIPLMKKVLKPKGLDMVYNVSFVGSNTHVTRKELVKMYSESFRFMKTDSWEEVMEQSRFSLCPRGFGLTSFRLFEAIQLGSIPIYVWDEDLLLPFAEALDWKSFSIILKRSNIDTLSSLVEKANVSAMKRELQKVQKFFTYEFTSKYIQARLDAESMTISLFSKY